jgi:hypothetical protein
MCFCRKAYAEKERAAALAEREQAEQLRMRIVSTGCGDQLDAHNSRAEPQPEQSYFRGFTDNYRNAPRSIDQQSSAMCEHSIAVAE